jgi:predicted permease
VEIVNVLTPVFLMIAIGGGLQRSGFASPGFFREANRLTYWLGLPALVFSQLAGSYHNLGGARTVLLAMVVATLAVIAVAYLVGWIERVPGAAMGTFVQGSFRGNLAFVGLPIVYSLPDAPLAHGLSTRTAAILVIAPMMVFYNVAGVIVLLLSQHALGWRMVGPLARQLATNPPLLATVAGLVFMWRGWVLPPALDKTFGALGEMALPLGLLGVGASVVTAKLAGNWRKSLGGALVKTLVSPALAWLVGRALGLGEPECQLIMLLMATPTAIVSYSVAMEMQGDETIAAGAIVLSVFASIIPLALIVGLF